ncbi:MAG: S41 family peptidase [Pseudomonadota bacterium]
MKTLLTSILALSFTIAAPAFAEVSAIKPRVAVEKIAAVIQTQFYDEARAGQIARDLRAEAGRGAYDRLTNPNDFATTLTARLSPLDGHFRVSWAPPEPAGAGARDAGPSAYAEHLRRTNYGFRRAEVLPGNIGYVEMSEFADFAPGDEAARKTADAALALIASTDAVIFDLRENGGGSPAMVGYLVGRFVAADANVYNTFKTRGEPDADERPTVTITEPRRLDTPMYVLISGRTGSAAESFAYTLKSAGRAVIVGERSAGAANPGGDVDVGDGLRIFVSNGTPINPITGKNWEGTGVSPDVEAPSRLALVRAQRLALTKLAATPGATSAAVENRWALEALADAPAVEPGKLAAYAGDYGVYQVATADGRLVLRQGRRPEVALKPLDQGGLFVVEGSPLRRMRFEDGALIVLRTDGSSSRYARSAGQAAEK